MAKSQTNKNKKEIKEEGKGKSILLHPIPLYFYALLLIAMSLIWYFANKYNKTATEYTPQNITSVNDNSSIIIREKDTGLIKPMLLEESNEEEASLVPIKIKINEYLEQKKNEGIITTASVYLKKLNSVNDLEINPDELYDPASLIKVPMMMLYLSKEDENPGLLNKTILYSKPISGIYTATIKSHSIQLGKSYTIKELLYYMIVYSDNEAFLLLGKSVNYHDFEKLCTEFYIPIKTDNIKHSDNAQNFVADVNSISRFFRVLYNSTYLSKKSSQFALSLLTQSDFKDGILKGVDPSVRVAHKFGEREEGGVAQLHEFGIVYIKNNPYLLGVMTKGTNTKQLAEVIGSISKISFEGINNN